MLGRSGLSRTGSFRPENLGQNALHMIGHLCFTLFVIGVLVFTIIAATYEPKNPIFHPSTKIETFLTSSSNATFLLDNTVVRTGEDFMVSNQTAFATFINAKDVVATKERSTDEISLSRCEGDWKEPIDCKDPEVFYLMMKVVIERFEDIHFYQFGKPNPGPKENTCDMAWRIRPKEGKTVAFYKDYRRFVIKRSKNCKLSVVSIGDYHSGVNARKKKRKNQKPGFEQGGVPLPVVGEPINDSLPVVESEIAFSRGKYLIYAGGGDRCKNMNHYLWSFLCALGEAQYLNRTLVMDLTLCLSLIYTLSNEDEEGKDFRFYFDFEHLKETASVLDQQYLTLYLVEDSRVTPMQLSEVKDSLIMRKFGSVEPDNYWYRVCEGETESVIRRPWHLVWKSRRLMDIVSAIASRGDKARNSDLLPNLAQDTSPNTLISTLQGKIEDGRNVYVATNEPNMSFFDPLKDKYSTHFLEDYKDLWDENKVFFRGKKQIETFNDLTDDCKDGVNTCNTATS
ncbi:hypothetical protein V6Z11_A07G101300 [Gossypium hirsutum]